MSSSTWREARNRHPVYAGLAHGFKPRKRQTLSQWACENLVLPAERASLPGPYRPGDAVYQRAIMDAITDPDISDVVMVTSAQVGKTTVLVAALGYFADAEPSPQLMVHPTQINADEYLEEALEPTIAASPALAAVFTGLSYPGGYVALVGANNPRQLAARPIRVVVGDEVDRWPLSAGDEGTPAALAEKRTITYHNRKHVYASTPRHTKTSQIVAMFMRSRQHYYHVVCPDCGHKQVLQWKNVAYTKGREAEATYHCESCGVGWDEMRKRALVRDAEQMGGGWLTAKKAPFKCFETNTPAQPNKIGFYLNELYSPWSSMAKMAVAWTEAEGNPADEQVFYNTRLGLPWDGNFSDVADVEGLKNRRETYSPRICPKDAGLVTGSVDVQDDRIEILTTAWGLEDEQWVLEHIIVNQDPSIPATWDHVAEVLARRYRHETGLKELGVEVVAVDSGGHFTQEAYKFAARGQKRGLRWHAIKGVSGEGKPIWRISENMQRKGVPLVLVGVDDAKTTIYKRYALQKKGPGYIHLHEGLSDKLLEQMTVEHVEIEYSDHGFPKRVWDKKPGARNEGLDMMVYNLAARSSMKIDMAVRLTALNQREQERLDPAKVGAMFAA
ncbi:phage terminase large subunit family protein [Methylocystis hirsuta]|uniref:Phage terminase large subunit family protein n=1 Tax=Methylocystis hirsuta TaxID=369798 RepID=A0A3M9XNZ3_9HYPH|nr:terminase gpA endonuclease subunit [Methylocystis hirsuta]RNJ49376.1 hypothetical protein D1O30_06950 [Methylocystis hirsuta]